MNIKVFNYNQKYDFFTVREEFVHLMEELNLCEWTPVVWIGRLFILDNDYGEHIFDRWDEREAIENQRGVQPSRSRVPRGGNQYPCTGKAAGDHEGDGCQRHPHLPQPARSGIA